MNPVDGVTEYRNAMTRRLRLSALIKGFAIVMAVALCCTVAFAWLLTRLDPSPVFLTYSRVALLVCLAISAIATIAIPVVQLTPMAVARAVEKRFPQFGQRLVTLEESRHDHADPFMSLIAEDTLGIARGATPQQLVGLGKMFSVAAMAAATCFLLVSLVMWPHGVIGNEAKALWIGSDQFTVELKPLHKTVLRDSAVIVAAHLNGFSAKQADLLVRYAGSPDWKKVSMLPGADESEFVFAFNRLSSNAEMYVKAEGVRSAVSVVKTIDLPRVRSIAASYQSQEQENGDIVAPIGTLAKLRIETDRPMTSAELVVEPGDSLPLPATSGNATFASLSVMRDAFYHVSVRYQGELVQVSDEHAIEVPMLDKSRPRPVAPVNVRTGPIPPGYESAVAAYYKRLSEVQAGSPQ